VSGLSQWEGVSSSPDLGGGLDDQLELGALRLCADFVALIYRCEPGLRRQRQALDWDVPSRRFDTTQRVVARLESSSFDVTRPSTAVISERRCQSGPSTSLSPPARRPRS
jgi:hypothetical protein